MNVAVRIDEHTPARYLTVRELVSRVRTYDRSVNRKLLVSAYSRCKIAHGSQMRFSGDPYYAHPISVAEILTGLRMDVDSVCTALLHDVLEDTDTTETEMRAEFGDIITDLVKGVTKLGQVELSSQDLSAEDKQAENFQKFVLAMSQDVRVLLIKLCDRLHNMRTLQYHPKPESRERIARETMEIYAPLARKVGVERICSELEDLSFKFINPSAYESIDRRLTAWRENQEAAISQLSIMIREILSKKRKKARVFGREKRPFAIWCKLQRQGIAFEDVADIYAFRIVVDKVEDCYEILGILHRGWRCVPDRFRDFISVPKSNGYQSLHTTILGPDNQRVEIQLRTETMNDVAERGIAAHWSYKNRNYSYDPKKSGEKDPLHRIRPLVEMIEHGGAADEFLEHAKLEMYADQVFTFTPKNKLIALPQGATPLDFAYAVHTKVGDTCIGAIINGREHPLRTQLQNGDVVKIIRGGTAEPQPGWGDIVVTGKARSALRRLTRRSESQEFRNIGYMLADHAFAREDKNFSESVLTDALTRLKYKNVEQLYIALGRGKLGVNKFMDTVFPGFKRKKNANRFAERDLIEDATAKLYVRGQGLTQGISLHLGECCHPIPGDRIVGIQEEDKGVIIHTIDCDKLALLEDRMGGWIDMGWRKVAENTIAIGQLVSTIEHVPGALSAVTGIISDADGNVTDVKTLSRSPSFFEMALEVEVTDAKHLSQIVAAMRASAYVVSVHRARAQTLKR